VIPLRVRRRIGMVSQRILFPNRTTNIAFVPINGFNADMDDWVESSLPQGLHLG